MSRTRDGHHFDGTQVVDGLITDAVESGTPTHALSSSYDVIVVGAGFAGLVAARNLRRRHGLSVLLIEARDRIGGRTWTAKVWGEEVEMGGTWVHWNQPHLYAEAHHQGMHRAWKTTAGVLTPEQALFKPLNGSVKELNLRTIEADIERFAAEFFTIDGLTARQLMPWPHDPWKSQPWTKYDHLSIRDRLDAMDLAPAESKIVFEAHMTCIGSAPADELSFTEALRWFVLGGSTISSMYATIATFKFGNGGMTNFARRIFTEYGGDSVFDHKVTSIEEVRSRVHVTCADGSRYDAAWMICTIPLTCLSDVRFDPPLTGLRQEATEQGLVSDGAKYTLSIEEEQPNWFANTVDDAGSDFLYAFVDHHGTKPGRKDGTFIIGFAWNGKLQDPTQHDEVIAEFKKLQPQGNVRGYVNHNWAKDPLAKGVWYCGRPGDTTKYLKALQEPHGRIVFASSDWANGWRGFVDGAIEQGELAAEKVVSGIA